MVEFLAQLEPRREAKLATLYNELEEFTEIFFFNKGQVEIGYELNRKKYFVLRRGTTHKLSLNRMNSNKCALIIADYGCTFNLKSQFIFRTYTECTGFSIRKQKWLPILQNYPEISQQVKQRVVTDYFLKVQLRVLSKKNQTIRNLRNRADVQQILTVTDLDKSKMKLFLTSQFHENQVENELLQDLKNQENKKKLVKQKTID